MSNWTTQQKLEKANEIKEEGNKLVKEGQYRKAAKTYRTVFFYVNGLISKENEEMAKFSSSLLSEEESLKVKELKTTTNTNLALCYLKLEEPEKVIECAEKALKYDPKNAKANLRLGSAYLQLKMWEKAKPYLIAAYNSEPNNVTIKNELKIWKSGYEQWSQEQKMKEKQAFGGKLLS